MSVIAEKIALATDIIANRMTKNQAFSIKTMDSWLQAERVIDGDRARLIVLRNAIADLVAVGTITRRDGRYAPNVTEGYILA